VSGGRRNLYEKEHREDTLNGRPTYLSRFAFAFFLTLVPVSHLQAQVDQGAAGGSQTQELVDHLKEMIRGAEKDQRSNPWLSKQLRELVRRYDHHGKIV
jgi:hypothetical protein